jgi:hypothetical protein
MALSQNKICTDDFGPKLAIQGTILLVQRLDSWQIFKTGKALFSLDNIQIAQAQALTQDGKK